jgi:hypothetical protein
VWPQLVSGNFKQMNSRAINRCLVNGVKAIVVTGAICVSLAQGQPAPQVQAPPPMKSIPLEERNQINRAGDTKTRIRRTIEFAEQHLQHSETLAAEQKYDQALTALGNYLALMDDGLEYLSKLSDDPGKNRDRYKQIELALRAHGPRLTTMRRATPLEYATRIKEVEDFARQGRTEALNAFYGNTVVHERMKPPPEDNKSKEIKSERQP